MGLGGPEEGGGDGGGEGGDAGGVLPAAPHRAGHHCGQSLDVAVHALAVCNVLQHHLWTISHLFTGQHSSVVQSKMLCIFVRNSTYNRMTNCLVSSPLAQITSSCSGCLKCSAMHHCLQKLVSTGANRVSYMTLQYSCVRQVWHLVLVWQHHPASMLLYLSNLCCPKKKTPASRQMYTFAEQGHVKSACGPSPAVRHESVTAE